MKRRKFIGSAGITAFGIGVFGHISWENEKYIGDTPTTTDILGPFYRPHAPFRVDINPKGYAGSLFHLSGRVYNADGKTPFANGLVEIWQCDEHKVYDNTSDDFRYRGSQKVDKNGRYHFITTHPVPYPITENSTIFRPAHIHLRVSGEGQQDLITQIYFKNDPYIASDASAKTPDTINRILTVKENARKEMMVEFNVVMQKEFKPALSVFKKIAGIYQFNDDSMSEFYQNGDMLFLKVNGQIVEGLRYIGENTFYGGGADGTNSIRAVFELLPDNAVKVYVDYHSGFRNIEGKKEGLKVFKY